MATLPLRALWTGDKSVAFTEGSTLDTDLRTLIVLSADVRLPFGPNETVAVRVEVTGGRVYEGQVTSKMPRDVGGRNLPTVHIYEFTAAQPLTPAN